MWISRDEKLKKISDAIFQEAKHLEDRSQPLEWRRSFNFVKLPLKNIKIINSCTVHDSDFIFDEDRNKDPVNFIKPNVKSKISITGILDEEKMRDRIYFAIEEDKNNNIYGVECNKGKTIITLKSGEPTEESDNIPVGLYWGNAFRINYEPDRDDLCFELSMPKEQINDLVSSLKEDQSSILEVGAYLLSYTYEVDDALREPYYPRDIIINDLTLCFASWAGVTSIISEQEQQDDLEHDKEDDDAEHNNELIIEQRSHQELLQAVMSYSKPLNSLITAVWVLIVVIALNTFFS